MPTLYSNADSTRFTQNAEQQFNQDSPCIIDRLSIDIVAGTATYTLPDYVMNIRRITYRGYKLDPLPQRDLRQYFLSGTQAGRPYWYVFNNIGQQKIQLFNVPVENIAAATTNLYGAAILTSFIIEFYRLPDFNTFIIPTYLRNRVLNTYKNYRLYSIDNKGVNAKAAKYWAQKWQTLQQLYGNTLDDLLSKPRNIICSNDPVNHHSRFPPPPILPIARYGRYVDDET